ncbi:McrB family protein [Flavobacterium sp. RS13.1]|uniref:McrB family protein n=1 Tax=Flavobacterium sp. RS13.1 TaxID=3400345 RepID=UPI003AAFF25B
MNYWHMQLHPDDRLSVETVVSILETKQVIGLGDSWKDKNGNPNIAPEVFENQMKIGDIVMIRDTITPVALVRIESKAFLENKTNEDFDWFNLRRNITLVAIYEDSIAKIKDRLLKKYDKNYIQAPGTLTKCQGNNATNDFIREWYKVSTRKTLMENIKLSPERQSEIKIMWLKYKDFFYDGKKNVDIRNNVEALLDEWKKYASKIKDNSFSIDDYTNRLNSDNAQMPGGYLCNFLERTTSTFFGSSKPGNANNFEIKLNFDGETYTIRKELKHGEKENRNDKSKASILFDDTIKKLFQDIVNTGDPTEKIPLVETSEYTSKQILRKMAVLDNTTDFLFIYSDSVIDFLHNEFVNSDEQTNLGKNYEIRTIANQILDLKDNNVVDSVLLSWFLWHFAKTQSIADENTPNVILYGPPGTGKTFAVKESLNFICQGDRSRYEFVQFHPSFTYEDFIEGIKPKGVTKDGNIKFELVDGIFKRFCKKAKSNPDKKFYFVVDEINRANLSSVFGETLLCLEKDYRHDVVNGNNENLIKTQYSTLIEEMIKEDPDKEDLAYHFVEGNAYFGVPANVFFIGMMNDVDKSIDAFDLALRRRFKWIRKDCDYEVIERETRFKNGDVFTNIENYTLSCKRLNNYIANNLGLGKSYEFGHSFFMKMSAIAGRKEITKKNLEYLFHLHLSPTLKEYLRSMFAESELDDKLEKALAEFTKHFQVN